ncbi:MAG: hypothetical protein BBJ57_02605 [Desulfobacterales bacterium PC51MH44]|nr:MAG: hypothetical protein BBJ57_02605 [Desulfobacterales bacterium PC51MH44]
MGETNNSQDTEKAKLEAFNTEVIKKEIARLKRLREDVLLLRFYLARRADITKPKYDTDRLISENALKSSLEILEKIEKKKIPPIGHISSAVSTLMYAVDILVGAARMDAEQDATDEPQNPVTPESLRASLPLADIAAALGEKIHGIEKRQTAGRAKKYIFSKIMMTAIFFLLALTFHFLFATSFKDTSIDNSLILLMKTSLAKNMGIIISAFLWAIVGSYVFILIRFRQFNAAYAFDPALAKVFKARVYSGAVTSAVLLYFVFGGNEPWAENWEVNLPLWAFVLGYAGKLQVELLRIMVERVGRALTKFAQPPTRGEKGVSSREEGEGTPVEEPPTPTEPPPLEKLEKPRARGNRG